MGLCYRLFRDDNKEAFDLDKGHWCAIFPIGDYSLRERNFRLSEVTQSREELASLIKTKVYSPQFDCPDPNAYFLMLSKRIFAWGGDAVISLSVDTGDDPEWDTYKVTGDRFRPSFVEGYKEPS